jgi:hypothetical protein
VKNAVKRNAEDSSQPREDQWFWMQRFEKMVGVNFLGDDDEDKLDLSE